MKTLLRSLVALPLLASAMLASAEDGQPKLTAIRLNAGIHNIQAELALTPDQREIGLMYRKTMAATTACCSRSRNPDSSVSG